jgi:hypothetical protein
MRSCWDFRSIWNLPPKFRAGAEPVAEPQRRIGRDRALSVDDPSDSVHWDVELPRQFGGGNAEGISREAFDSLTRHAAP